MDEIDHALEDAWLKVVEQLRSDPAEAKRRFEQWLGATYQRPLRSWSLVLRANDKRIDMLCMSRVIDYIDWGDDEGNAALEEIRLTGEAVRTLCKPVMIPWPGVSIDKAAQKCGVNRVTIHRWVKAGRIVMEYDYRGNGTDKHRARKRVWTRSPIDPTGEIHAGEAQWWGAVRRFLSDCVPIEFEQIVQRTHRMLGNLAMVRFMRCPKCSRWVYKLFLPMTVGTMGGMLGKDSLPEPFHENKKCLGGLLFMCGRCAKLIYESAEKGSRPGKGRSVDQWDRFVKRISGGVLKGREVEMR